MVRDGRLPGRDGEAVEVPLKELGAGERIVDWRFFGLVKGLESELGYFVLSELRQYKGPLGIGIERDMYFRPQTLAEVAPEWAAEFDRTGVLG